MTTFKHLVGTEQLNRQWLEKELFTRASELQTRNHTHTPLHKALYLLFYEPSFLTRTSFERAMDLLGGQPYFTEDASQFFPVRTPDYIENTIRNLAALDMDAVVLRTGEPGIVERAADADAIPVINCGSQGDHPTQAIADLYTIHRERGAVDNLNLLAVGRLEHRNVNALLRGLALFENITVWLAPFSGQVDPDVVSYCQAKGVTFETTGLSSVADADVIYLNSPRTLAHIELLKSRETLDVVIDEEFISNTKNNCIVLDPMQRSGDFEITVQDDRLAYYRQAENALYTRMAVLSELLSS